MGESHHETHNATLLPSVFCDSMGNRLRRDTTLDAMATTTVEETGRENWIANDKAPLTPAGKGRICSLNSVSIQAGLFPATCIKTSGPYLAGGASCLSWLLRSSLLITWVMSTVFAASLALASSSCCFKMTGLGLERRTLRANGLLELKGNRKRGFNTESYWE